MKMKYQTIVIVLIALVALGSCKNKRSEADAMRKCGVVQDSTVYVQLLRMDSDSIDVFNYSVNSRYRFAYKDAKWNDHIAGSLTVGDTLAVVPNFKQRKVMYALNVSELLGLWFINGLDQEGIRFDISGGAMSVNTQKVSFRDWEFYNGRFILTYVKSDEKIYKEISDTSKIEVLNDKELKFTFQNKAYSCHRVKLLLRSDAS